jgi:hypothetical protein
MGDALIPHVDSALTCLNGLFRVLQCLPVLQWYLRALLTFLGFLNKYRGVLRSASARHNTQLGLFSNLKLAVLVPLQVIPKIGKIHTNLLNAKSQYWQAFQRNTSHEN